MPLRKLLLRILLWSLGVAAALGAFAVLSSNAHTVGRVIGTTLLTAAAALLMMGCSFLVDRPLTRAAGLLGITFVVVEYLLLLPITWLNVSGTMELTAGFLALPVVPAMVCLILARTLTARYAGWVGVGACGAVTFFTLAGLWVPNQRFIQDDNTWFAFAGAIALFGPLLVCCLVNVGLDARHWRWIGVACAVCAAAGMVHSIVNGTTGGENLFALIVTVAVLVAHANLVLLVPLAGGQRWVRWGTLAAALVTAVCIDVTVWADMDTGAWSLAKRLAGAAAIVAGCGSLALLVLARLNRKADRPTIQLDSVREFTMQCPVCGKRHTLTTGDSRCPTCNLIVHTRFEEPRCPRCDYSLLMLESDKWPECGTAVAGRGGGAPFEARAVLDR